MPELHKGRVEVSLCPVGRLPVHGVFDEMDPKIAAEVPLDILPGQVFSNGGFLSEKQSRKNLPPGRRSFFTVSTYLSLSSFER